MTDKEEYRLTKALWLLGTQYHVHFNFPDIHR